MTTEPTYRAGERVSYHHGMLDETFSATVQAVSKRTITITFTHAGTAHARIITRANARTCITKQ